MGEEGKYQFRRRVHGSVDIFGEPKPSYYVVQDYCSPIQVEEVQRNSDERIICLSVKNALPSYLVDGYEIVLYNDGETISKLKIPTLEPGEDWQFSIVEKTSRMQIIRPNGFVVKEIEW